MDRARLSGCWGFHWNKRRNSLLGNKLTVVPVLCDTREWKCQTVEHHLHVSSEKNNYNLSRKEERRRLCPPRSQKVECFVIKRISFSLFSKTLNRMVRCSLWGVTNNIIHFLWTPLYSSMFPCEGPNVSSSSKAYCVNNTKFPDTGRFYPRAFMGSLTGSLRMKGRPCLAGFSGVF